MGINLEFALLKGDPFLIEAPLETESSVWADMNKERESLERIISTALFSGVTQVIFNRSAWGAGKTHASRYFTREEHVRIAPFEGWIKCIYMETPKDADQAVQVFYERVLEELRWESIKRWIIEAHETFGEQEAYERFFSIIRDSDLTRMVWLLGKQPEYNEVSLRQYLVGPGLTRTQLIDFGVAKNMRIRDVRQRVGVLTAILKAAMGFKDAPTGRVFIWIDETEDINLYSGARRGSLTGLWRDLVDSMPRGLTLFLNYTPRMSERVDVHGIFGEGLVSRFTATMSFDQLSEEESIIYISDLLNCSTYREKDPGSLGLPATYPFQKELIEFVLPKIEIRTPRNINLAFGWILRSALQEGIIHGIGEGIIERDYAEQRLTGIEQLLGREKGLIE